MILHPAIGHIEVASLARGMVITDGVVKKAAVDLLSSNPISPGRYITTFWGSVAEVEESMAAGLEIAGDSLVDSLFLPGADHQLIDVLTCRRGPIPPLDALGIFETYSIASALLSVDAACKAAEVNLLEVRLAQGIGGKGFWVVSGDLCDVEAAVEAGRNLVAPHLLVNAEIIARPHKDMTDFIW